MPLRRMATGTVNRFPGGRMLGWAIMTLACVGYFLGEAARAPIIEDDASAIAPAPRHDQPDPGMSGLEAAAQPLSPRGVPDQ